MDEQMHYRRGDEGKRSLVRKLAEVMGDIERVPKSGHNKFHGYDYATEADIVSAVRAGMSQRMLMMVPSVLSDTWAEKPKGRLVKLRVRFTVHDGDSGEELSFEVLGEGEDQGDKATYKAMTGATKYALLKLFLIPTGDDPEQDEPQGKGRGQGGHGQQSRQQPAAQHGERRTQPAQAPHAARQQPATIPGPMSLVADGGDFIGYGQWTGTRLSQATPEQVTACVADMKARLSSDKPVHNADVLKKTLGALEGWLAARARAAASSDARQAPAEPGKTVVAFGPYKGKTVGELADAELGETIDLADARLAEQPKARWAPAMRANLEAMHSEAGRRAATARATHGPGAEG